MPICAASAFASSTSDAGTEGETPVMASARVAEHVVRDGGDEGGVDAAGEGDDDGAASRG